jgi:hypothetical protein
MTTSEMAVERSASHDVQEISATKSAMAGRGTVAPSHTAKGWLTFIKTKV